ncbi:MAG: hypothetical protein HOL98_07710 [Gammaproteobacteria bacterium]|nr:hypothetical protein [Gammaproteobacteria bacterium]MBT5203325.1 hypothetical protein [Gammaproteobacteria bacterium]MBT5602484.1 hypothetical protein [Gammaproteobacteria bacterium]MBT6247172.1 hypothetical protein [Gammaproteobacteria bacterium]
MTRLLSTVFFASAFIWVAIEFFDVDIEVIKVLFIYSLLFVVLLILTGLIFSPVVSFFRRPRKSSLLEKAPTESSSKDEIN